MPSGQEVVHATENDRKGRRRLISFAVDNLMGPPCRLDAEWQAGLHAWSTAVAQAMTAPSPAQACRDIGWGLAALFGADTWYFIFFRHDEVPIMYDYFDADTREDRYCDGPYLLDPFYMSYLRGDAAGTYLKRDLAPEDLSEIDAYVTYDQEIFGPMDEVGLVTDIDDKTRSLVCFARASARVDQTPFDGVDLRLLDTLEPVISAVVGSIWSGIRESDSEAKSYRTRRHAQIAAIFNSFGSDRLTEREMEVSNLMVKGFNASEIGDLLGITAGTARNHIKSVYQKLEVSSQRELCGMFIEQLLARDGA
jgi:DNA-binding CsgD family transcriptional regulator